MPRKSAITPAGKEFLRGGRLSVTKRGFGPPPEEIFPLVTLPTGETLNSWESEVYQALVDLNVNFDAQVRIGGSRVLGGGLVDFVLIDYNLALEIQGPFHDTVEGPERDFWRNVVRAQAGLMTVYIREDDFIDIHRALTLIMGAPMIAAVMRRR